MILVKICGIASVDDALLAAWAGADLVGFVLAPSPRRADLATARAAAEQLEGPFPHVGRVGVFVDPSGEEVAEAVATGRLTHVQIHGRRPADLPEGIPWIAAVPLASAAEAVLPDGDPWAVLCEPRRPGHMGGSGQVFAWEWVQPLLERTRIMVAGGLDAERVVDLLARLTPFGVDASSRLEKKPGIKDPRKVRAFVDAVRSHDPASRATS